MGREIERDEPHLGQAQGLGHLDGETQMAVVYGVEGPTQDP
jgi:hypothetical protein